MKTELRSSVLVFLALGLASAPLVTGCDGDGSSAETGGNTTQGGGGTTAQGGGGTGGTTAQGGGGTSAGGNGGNGGGGAAPTGDYDCSAPTGDKPALKLTEIASGLDRPMYIRAAPGDDERLYIVEQTGTIRILKNGVLLDEPFLDISDRSHPPSAGGDERGFLGLAFHPNYVQNGRFFVFYTEEAGSPGDQVIAEYARSDNPDLAVAQPDGFGQETQVLIKVDDNEGNHNGGMIDFSPVDGYLYIGLGDGGGSNDQVDSGHGPFGNGQNLATMWGKILRIDVDKKDAGKNYAVPAGNLTAKPANNPTTGDVIPEIWDFGLRNPWRFSFDPCNGNLYIGDVGQGAWEEVDIEKAGQGNKNYGWVYREGNHDKFPNLEGSNQVLTPAVAEYSHAGGNCSITGGFVYRSSAIPALRGTYFYGDYCSGKVWSFVWDGNPDGSANPQNITELTQDLDGPGNISSFGYDNKGNVYLVELSGSIYRIDAE